MSPTVYLITGANGGIGLALVTEYAQRANNIIVAGVRDNTKSAALRAIVPASSSKIIIVKIDSLSATDPATAVASLSKHSITHLDVVIANAGIANHWGSAITTPAEELEVHLKVNAVGPLVLFQAVYPLLEKSTVQPKFVAISTGIASITDMEQFPVPSTAYGTSKAALNYVMRKLHFEHPNIVIYPINPGWVQTDMGSGSANSFGMEDAPTTLVDSIVGVTKSIDNATREGESGKLVSFDGTLNGW
ncbi:putative aflatoxin biosynthesis ketoreductase nor-1 [Hyaloscypha variabilis F]|uniref:Putative aflatoxin biosynthesis ketoreductase nor-1 n=1 Tax=Hyaloscypha variabilis (strain UAMH 11265 / GT02V1 / F) TaxID=1149755 RepID=A0A2J6QZ09_HYAVF|nr:putative aflatoxin biosynthesis ketoreductase nor-1 [Hyaloscypha variabilis F]